MQFFDEKSLFLVSLERNSTFIRNEQYIDFLEL